MDGKTKNFTTIDYYDTYKSLNMPMDFWNEHFSKNSEKEILDIAYDMIKWPAGYPDCLKGLSIEEQVEYYGVSSSYYIEKASYGETDKTEHFKESGTPLKDYSKLEKLIVKDGIVIGAIIYAVGTYKSMFPYRNVTTYLSVDTDGSGSSTGEESAYLYCVPLD